MPESFFDRLREVMHRCDINQSQLAELTGIDIGTISRWKRRGITPQRGSLLKICQALGCTEEYLRGDTVELPPNTAIPHAQSRIVPTVLVPLLGRVPAGIPERMEEAVEEWIAMPGAQADTYALKVHGESMLPELRHGDVVFFRLDREPRPGDLVVVNDEFGDSMLKRLRLKEGEWYLVSDNPAYPTVRPNGEYRIMGVVVDAWRQLTI